jgi:hypothetical protein
MTTNEHQNMTESTAFPGQLRFYKKKIARMGGRECEILGKQAIYVAKTPGKGPSLGPKHPDSDAFDTKTSELEREKGHKRPHGRPVSEDRGVRNQDVHPPTS